MRDAMRESKTDELGEIWMGTRYDIQGVNN